MNGESRLAKLASALMRTEAKLPPGMAAGEPPVHALASDHTNEMVYRLLPRRHRRTHGIFFSGPTWARALVGEIDLNKWTRFLDPSAGTGDILLEVCKGLPLEETSEKTISAWEKRLAAVDLRESFLQIAWARIQALAMVRHGEAIDESLLRPLPSGFRAGDVLTTHLDLQPGDCIVMNPPYHISLAAPNSFVGSGMRSSAALHLEYLLRSAPENVAVIALVPDVLRSGSSYRRFRSTVLGLMEVESFNGEGFFGEDANVDVAILRGVSRRLAETPPSTSSAPKNLNPNKAPMTVADLCSVSVGPVVPHRTEETGKLHGYLTAKNSPLWGLIEKPTMKARFNARLTEGPFVVVRRTSSPRDKQRARATLVRGKGPWLVENHLLVIAPRSQTIKDCRTIVDNFKNERTNEWLNQHIRCRHLTVGAISSVPIWGNQET